MADMREAGKDMLVFIHGLGCSKVSFHHFWHNSRLGHFSALAPDLIGFGGSDKPKGFSYTMEAQAKVCADILATFPKKHLHIVAHSMGGAIGLLLPDEILNRVQTFVNVEGNLIDADCGIVSRKIASTPADRFKTDLLPRMQRAFNQLGDGYADIDSCSPQALYLSAQSLVDWSDGGKLLQRFRRLGCRRVYFFGDENEGHPTLSHLEDIDQIKISGSGHFPMNDNPNEFYEKLYDVVQNGSRDDS
jgi:pimeloyl-ACP methyl ester carboxylesterase